MKNILRHLIILLISFNLNSLTNIPVNLKLVRLGSNYGGWTIPSNLLNEKSICYCAGAGEDISFDVNLIKQFKCNVFCFDPTPRSIEHINELRRNTTNNIPFYTIPDKLAYNANESILSKLNFYPFGLWNQNTIMKFYIPKNPNHVSHSIANLQKTDSFFEAQCYSLTTLMNKFNHKKIDLLKLDIEGAEIAVINDIIKNKIDVKCICIEFDELVGVNLKNNIKNKEIKNRVDQTITSLIKNGYILIFQNKYDSLTFLKNEILKEMK